jgi:hypothetical protein
MKNNNVLIAVGLAAVGGVVYFASKVKKQKEQITDAEIKAKQDAQAAADALAKAKSRAKADAESLQNKNSLAAKVATIQLYLGVGADGVVGQNTNIALKKKFPAYSTITSANVDKIIADIESDKKAASDLSAKKVSDTALQQKKALAARLSSLTQKGKGYYAVLLNPISAPAYIWDNLTSSYKYLGYARRFDAFSETGKAFTDLVDRQNGDVFVKDGDIRFQFNPNVFTVKTY